MSEIREKLEEQKNYETFFDVYSFDNSILKQRKENARIKTILSDLVSRGIVWDEIHLLAHILNVLDENNLAVSQKEVRTALNKFYKEEFHEKKQGYLNFLYKTGQVKKGTITNPSNSHKHTLAVISKGNSDENPYENKKLIPDSIQDTKIPNNSLNDTEKDTTEGNDSKIKKIEVNSKEE